MLATESLVPPRPRRNRHESSKVFDAERKLDLSEVLDVLQTYVDYEGGINCSLCGKLYKSKVCFIKHLWEHSVYWDLFAGDKNHMRVLSIQAALILYGACQQRSAHPLLVESLLVSSPHADNGKEMQGSAGAPVRHDTTSIAENIDSSEVSVLKEVHLSTQSTPRSNSNMTRMVTPHTPSKSRRKRRFSESDNQTSGPETLQSYFVPRPGLTADDLYWKESDTLPFKRKRSE